MNATDRPASAAILRILRMLHGVDLFAMLPDADLEQIQLAGQVRLLGPGETLFRAGDPPDRIHVILGGVIEVVRSTPGHPEPSPVAYLSPGEAIGDMELITGSSRRSSGRVPEHAEVWTLDRPSFEQLTRTIPGYGIQVAKVFARRLEEFITQAAILRILRGVDLFAMLPDADLEQIQLAGHVRLLGPGETLFRAGDPPDRIHVILSGVIEVVRSTPDRPEPSPVAYLSPGETIGDMGLITGSSRRSSGRVPEHAEVWTLDRPSFEQLTRTIPGYGMQVAKVFAQRLEEFITHARGQARRKELSGKLKFFDLPTVVQTLVTANQTGILTLTNDQEKSFAEVLLRDGAVERARCGAVEGEEAFYQLFMAGSDGGFFFFRSVAEPNRDSVSRTPITISALNLLMESMRLVDELPEMKQRLPDPERPYRALTGEMRWTDDRTLRAAHDILAKLKTPHRISELVNEVPCSTYTLYRIAADLFDSKQIG